MPKQYPSLDKVHLPNLIDQNLNFIFLTSVEFKQIDLLEPGKGLHHLFPQNTAN